MIEYLEACLATEEKRAHDAALARVLEPLPTDVLRALADGRAKLAFGPCPDGWVEKFKGTQYQQKAIELEKQELELDVQRAQWDEQQRANRFPYEEFEGARDKIRLQKRLLDLEYLEMCEGAGVQPPKGAPEMPVKVEVKQPSPPKPVGEGEAMLAAGQDEPKVASPVAGLLQRGAAAAAPLAGRAMAAAQPMLQAARPMATKAMTWAAANPEAAGAMVGAAGGALTAGEGHRLQGAVGGAATGGLAGAMFPRGPAPRGVLGGAVMARGAMPMAANPAIGPR